MKKCSLDTFCRSSGLPLFLVALTALAVTAWAQQEASSAELQVSQGPSQYVRWTVFRLTNPHQQPLDVVYSSGNPGLNPKINETWDQTIADGTDDNDTDWDRIDPGQTITTEDNTDHPMFYWVCPAGLWPFDPVLGHEPWWSSHANGHRVVCSPQMPVAKTL